MIIPVTNGRHSTRLTCKAMTGGHTTIQDATQLYFAHPRPPLRPCRVARDAAAPIEAAGGFGMKLRWGITKTALSGTAQYSELGHCGRRQKVGGVMSYCVGSSKTLPVRSATCDALSDSAKTGCYDCHHQRRVMRPRLLIQCLFTCLARSGW